MRRSFVLTLGIVFVLLSASAEAKIFDITKETFASYLLIGGGAANIRQAPFINEADSSLTYSDEHKNAVGGEFGFLYSNPAANFRFGFEVLKPALLGATATNSSGTALYDVNDNLTAYAPKVGLELNFKLATAFRAFVLFNAGLSSLSLKNDYKMTAAGSAAFPGVVDHSVEAKSSAAEYGAGVGLEFLLSDNTTLMAEAIYRQLKFSELKYTKDVSTFSGSKSAGDIMKDVNGANREIDFSGFLASVGLRIYL